MAADVSLVYLSTASTLASSLFALAALLCARFLSLCRGEPTTEECHAGLTWCICLSHPLHPVEKSSRRVRPAEMDGAEANPR